MYEILEILTPPTALAVPLALAKLQCRVDTTMTTEDALIMLYIQAATGAAESYMKRTLVNTQYTITRDFLPSNGFNAPTSNLAMNQFLNTSVYPYTLASAMKIMKPPLITVDSIRYRDNSGTWQTLASNLYTYNTGSPGRLSASYGAVWPFTLSTIGAVKITYTAGSGFLSDGITPNVPTLIQAGILQHVGEMYLNREASLGMSDCAKNLYDSACVGFYR